MFILNGLMYFKSPVCMDRSWDCGIIWSTKAQQSHEAILDASTLLEAEPGEQGRRRKMGGVSFLPPLKPLVGYNDTIGIQASRLILR